MVCLDHIAIACSDLACGTAWAEETFGVTMQPGGKHGHFGTHNTLLGMGDLYLEVIAIDSEAPPTGRATWFGLDHFTGPPRLCNWICRSDNLALAPSVTGPPLPLSRGALRWQITVPKDGNLPLGGAFPTLLQWAEGVTRPADNLPDSGIRLTRLEVRHPEADYIARTTQLSDLRVDFLTGPMRLSATFATPAGPVTL